MVSRKQVLAIRYCLCLCNDTIETVLQLQHYLDDLLAPTHTACYTVIAQLALVVLKGYSG